MFWILNPTELTESPTAATTSPAKSPAEATALEIVGAIASATLLIIHGVAMVNWCAYWLLLVLELVELPMVLDD